MPEAKQEESREIDARVLAGDMVDGVQVERVRADGSPIVIRGSAAPLRDAEERVNGVLVACVDVTEARHAADELERQMHFSRAVIDAIPNPVYFKDRDGRYTMHNRAWGELFAGGENWIGKTVFDMYGPDIAATHQERDRPLLRARPSSTTYEVLTPTALGETRQMLYNKVSFVDQKGEVAGLIGTVTDVTRYKETERALEASEARFRVLTESSLDLISVVDADGTLRYQSGALTRKASLGYDPADTVGRNVFDLVHADDSEHFRAAVRRIVETRQSSGPLELRFRHRDGAWRTFESLGTNCLANPHIHGVVFNSRDVTDRKVIQQRIQHLAYHDNLTGLPNRSLLQGPPRARHRARRALRTQGRGPLHRPGQLQEHQRHAGSRRRRRAAAPGVAAALGLRAHRGHHRAPGRRRVHRAAGQPRGRARRFDRRAEGAELAAPAASPLGATEQHVSGSVGISLYPEDGRDAQTLMKNADTAMFHGKSLGKNTYKYFTAQMNIAVKRRMTLESALRRAVMQKNFVLHYQPQINLESGAIIAVEALVRWKTEDSGTVMPGDFIPLAEETGLINEIGEWVLREGCRQAKEWQEQGLDRRRRMAVNLSARQFADRSFFDMVTRVLADTRLDPSCLELEITESQVMRQTEGVMTLLNRLSKMGVQLAIDDFGTGYSSLSYLKRLPIQKLKIDQSFVRDITVDPNDTAIVVAIINMAKSLDLETIAEGVETAGQLALLRSKGCRIGQGFYFSAPLRAEALYPLLRRNNLYQAAD